MAVPIIDRTMVLTLGFADEHLPEQALLTTDLRSFAARTASFLEALASGHQSGTIACTVDGGNGVAATGTVTLSSVTGTAATGSVALSGVGGTAATGTVTLGGGAGNVTIVTDGTSVGPVAFNTSDAQTALDCITALNANGTFAAKATASDGGSGVVLITWDTKGTVGNSKTLTASRTAGTATASGATLSGGAQGSVGVTIDGTLVTTDTTTLSDTAAATAVAAAIEANGTLGPLLAAVGDGTDVEITWGTKGAAGNVTLSATSATGTATASGANLAGGANNAVTVTINGVAVATTTTTAASDTAAAALVASSINNSANALVNQHVTATSALGVVTLVYKLKGAAGNSTTLSSSATSGTATASGARLTGGTNATDNTVTI